MKSLVVFLCFASLRVFGDTALPKELVGEWRTRAAQPYDAIYLRPNGTTGFIAAGYNQVSVGGDGVARFDAARRELTLQFPDSPRKHFRFIYDPKHKTLKGEAGKFSRHSDVVPEFLARLRP